MQIWIKTSVQNNKFSQKDSLNEHYLEGYILFQYEQKETKGGGVFVYVNKVLKPKKKKPQVLKKRIKLRLCGLQLFVKLIKKLNQETFTDHQEWKLDRGQKHLYFNKL